MPVCVECKTIVATTSNFTGKCGKCNKRKHTASKGLVLIVSDDVCAMDWRPTRNDEIKWTEPKPPKSDNFDFITELNNMTNLEI